MSRLFHSLVVCGAGLTLAGCGGRTSEHEAAPSVGGGGSGSGSGGAGGPLLHVDLGGTASGASASGASFGGTGPAEILPGADAQWSCSDQIADCGGTLYDGRMASGFMLSEPCFHDVGRPKSQEDCKPYTKFSCLLGSIGGQTSLMNCECLPAADACVCPALHQHCASAGSPVVCDQEQTVCGCAVTCITK